MQYNYYSGWVESSQFHDLPYQAELSDWHATDFTSTIIVAECCHASSAEDCSTSIERMIFMVLAAKRETGI